MVIARLPGWKWVDLGPNGGPYDVLTNPKVVVHTTEGSTIAGAESAFRDYPPHLGYDPVNRIKHQYCDLTKHSYALRGSESDDEFAIQIEVVGFADRTDNWPTRLYNNFAVDVVAPLEKYFKVPRRNKRFYGADEGIVLASPSSPIRLSNAAFRAYSGWLGHQHVPAPDSHWDPGRFLINKSFDYLENQEDGFLAGLTDAQQLDLYNKVKYIFSVLDAPAEWDTQNWNLGKVMSDLRTHDIGLGGSSKPLHAKVDEVLSKLPPE